MESRGSALEHRRAKRAAVLIVAALLAAGCSSNGATEGAEQSAPQTTAPPDTQVLAQCSEAKHMVVTDIDETLTVSDGELLRQMNEPGYVPVARPDAAAMIRDYSQRGYTIAYVTGRPVSLVIDGADATTATTNWLRDEGFPIGADTGLVRLWPTEQYPDIRTYKASVIEDLAAQGYALDFAYGNADTDAQAYADARVALDHTFMIGKNAGYGGTAPIEADGYTQHRLDHVDRLPFVCRR